VEALQKKIEREVEVGGGERRFLPLLFYFFLAKIRDLPAF